MAKFQTESQHYIFLLRIPHEFICQFICDEKLRTLFTNWNPLVCIPNDTFGMRCKGILADFSFYFLFDEKKKRKTIKHFHLSHFSFWKSATEKYCDSVAAALIYQWRRKRLFTFCRVSFVTMTQGNLSQRVFFFHLSFVCNPFFRYLLILSM